MIDAGSPAATPTSTLRDRDSSRWIGGPSTKSRGKILRRSSATGTRPNPSSCRSFLHDLQDRMAGFQLAGRGDQSTGNKLIWAGQPTASLGVRPRVISDG